MFKKRAFFLLSCLVFTFSPFYVPKTFACGHNSFYLGAGYEQLFMYTSEDRLSAGELGRITFTPGYGGNVVLGYDFCGSRWGIQIPFEMTRQKLNHQEWVNQMGSSIEGVLHLAEWSNGIDVHLVGGVGWSYISEGSLDNRGAGTGITVSFGPGISYFFHRTEKFSSAIVFEVPLRVINYFGEHLSAKGTTLFAVPLRLSVQFGF